MASKGPRSKLDHETRARRQKALEAPKEPLRPKTHWDHVLEEMVWLSKDFECERKWKLAQAKRVAIRASKSMVDQATRGERKVKEEEQRLRKLALNISKDVKKFWLKIEKLVLYKHQLELEERKKKALDKQLDFLLGQTERYSTMLAENLIDMPLSSKTVPVNSASEPPNDQSKEVDERGSPSDSIDIDDDFIVRSDDDMEDDEHTIEEDEALITEEERRVELLALQNEIDLPIEELLRRYTKNKVRREGSSEGGDEDIGEPSSKDVDRIQDSVDRINGDFSFKPVENWSDGYDLNASRENHLSVGGKIGTSNAVYISGLECGESNEGRSNLEGPIRESQNKFHSESCRRSDKESSPLDSGDELDDKEYVITVGEEKDDEATLSEEEELAKADGNDPLNEIKLLQQESEMSVEELLARYKKDVHSDDDAWAESEYSSTNSDEQVHYSPANQGIEPESFIPIVSLDDDLVGADEIEETPQKRSEGRDSENIIADAAAAARSAQPTGNTFSTTKVRTKLPFLIKYPLREYQHIGLDWLVTMYEKRLNGILADEMGLGKTIMTIALLAHLACEKGIWGPHLIVVPTSVLLNWETEFLKWCPAFKILTYFGSAKERKFKRQGWLKPNSFHMCITTYRLVIQDAKAFKRKKWKYLILDEAHLIKNWKSQRWQTLLNFNSKRRILLTGTPLQNDLMELWSLMHFLMPHVFQSHQEFKDWFCNPITGMVEGQEKVNKEVVDRLHNVLRPFILRRLKRDVEKQLPKKYEHVICCRLSKRQRNLYEDFIASSETQATLASANFFGMISVIMQLRKVCNHPDLFEGRPIISSFDMVGIDTELSSSVCRLLSSHPFSKVDLVGLTLVFTHLDYSMASWEVDELAAIETPSSLIKEVPDLETQNKMGLLPRSHDHRKKPHGSNIFEEIQRALWEERLKQARERAASLAWWNSLRCRKRPVYGTNLRKLVTIKHPVFDIHEQKRNPLCYMDFSSRLADIIPLPVERFQRMLELVECFLFAIPAARAPPPICWCSKAGSPVLLHPTYKEKCTQIFAPLLSPFRPAVVRRQVYFPDKRLIQFDCGKLQKLAILLRRLKSEGHRALIFTQMTKMLDILEAFINLYGYTYMRLDGSTQPEERQTLMQRFNTNPKFFLFILSTRSGGVGINLVGADTVIFYDSDWNPAMDQQAQDRCHRIGQTREVHIYRLISESTIEENILKKANQKRALDDLVIQSGGYNTEFFKKLDPMELFSGHRAVAVENLKKETSTEIQNSDDGMETLLSNDDVEAALKHAEDEADYMALKRVEQEEAVDNQEFSEEAIGRLEDDEFVNEDDGKLDDKFFEEQGTSAVISKESDVTNNEGNQDEERALTLVGGEEDVDMLADIKQMAAAAAAAGQAISSFENQLRPLDRYAMRFLDLWDPIIDKSAIESQADFEETEWELDRIEKFKEDLEAEIDEDDEPLLYERWDSEFATEAYRQQVEALTQRQLLEELECEAKEIEDAGDEICESIGKETEIEHKPKSKKKTKKAKFKSLKKGALASESETLPEEPSVEPMFIDDKVLSPDIAPHLVIQKKRKKVPAVPEEEKASKKSSKKLKKALVSNSVPDSNTSYKHQPETKELKSGEGVTDIDPKPVSRSKIGGKISITAMPLKRVLVIKPEKSKKKGSFRSRDCIPSPDPWSSQEDAILCAIVYEYDALWSLASDTLYGMVAGGFYRGRFRHPAHCCERFRELFFRYVSPTTENPNVEKISSIGTGKALLKVTEDHVRTLLDVASELPDNELLLQKHYTAILSSVWRAKSRSDFRLSMASSRNVHYSGERMFSFSGNRFPSKPTRGLSRRNLAILAQSSNLVAMALNNANCKLREEPPFLSSQPEIPTLAEQLELTLEFQNEKGEFGSPFLTSINISICGSDPPQPADERSRSTLSESSCHVAEDRFRTASKTCLDGDSFGWATTAFPSYDVTRHRSGSKTQTLGKQKAVSDPIKLPKSKVPRTTDHIDEPQITKPAFPSFEFSVSDISQNVDLLLPFDLAAGNERNDPFMGLDELSPVVHDSETMPHDFDPSFISGLEDYKSLVDIFEIR